VQTAVWGDDVDADGIVTPVLDDDFSVGTLRARGWIERLT
jgi:hypothetical protein